MMNTIVNPKTIDFKKIGLQSLMEQIMMKTIKFNIVNSERMTAIFYEAKTAQGNKDRNTMVNLYNEITALKNVYIENRR